MFPESKFTRVSDWCPNPEWWHATDVDTTEIEVSELVAAFVRALQPRLVIETGTAWGQTAKLIGEALVANGHGELITTEPDPERAAYCRELVDGLPIVVLEQESLSVTPTVPVDFVWCDSLLHLRLREFRHYRQWMEPGSIVGFHDAGPHKKLWGHISKAESRGELKTIRMRTPRGVVFAEVL